MASKPRTSKTKDDTEDRQLRDGLLAHAATLPELRIGGVVRTVADLAATLQARMDARARTAAARAAWRQAVAQEKAGMAASKPQVTGAVAALRVMYAGCNEELGDFGLKARKPRRPQTTEEKERAVARGKATRAARHTLGPRQRAKIQGTPAAQRE